MPVPRIVPGECGLPRVGKLPDVRVGVGVVGQAVEGVAVDLRAPAVEQFAERGLEGVDVLLAETAGIYVAWEVLSCVAS